MPKTKKFINKKEAVTFHLVHRSQQDPLVADENAPQHVLLPANTVKVKGDPEKRKEEQRKYGVFFDDDYNYLQHLRSVNEVATNWELEPTPVKHDFPPLKGQEVDNELPAVKIQLPSSVFASPFEENIGMLNKAAPRSGPCLELDPDVVAAMDEDFDFDDPDNELEDDFINLANADGGDNSSDGTSECDSEDEDGDEVGSLRSSECPFQKEETKSRFSNYSMSSSVIRRNDQLTLLDDRFDQFYAGYDDSEIGALDCEEIEGYLAPNSDVILQCVEEFEKKADTLEFQTENDKTLDLVNAMSDSEGEMDLIEVPDKTEKWDCESILSTYSNLYNHPKLISEPKVPKPIQISSKSGMPLNVLGGGENRLTAHSLAKHNDLTRQEESIDRAESIISTLSALSIRPKNETIEEKRERKKALREYRKGRRLERKLNTEAFREEKKRQEKILLNKKTNLQGIKIL